MKVNIRELKIHRFQGLLYLEKAKNLLWLDAWKGSDSKKGLDGMKRKWEFSL